MCQYLILRYSKIIFMELQLKAIRRERGKTQMQVADFLHIKQNAYSQYETGRREIPLALLVRLSEYYEVSVDFLLVLTDQEDPYPRRQ